MYQCMLYTSDFPELPLSIMYAVTCMPMFLRCLLETQASFRPKNAHRRTYHRSRLPARLALKTLPQKTISSVFYIGNSCTGYQLKVESSSGECLHFLKNLTHLAITLYRGLTLEGHFFKLKNKRFSPFVLTKRLVDLSWSWSFNVFRSSTISCVIDPAAYC